MTREPSLWPVVSRLGREQVQVHRGPSCALIEQSPQEVSDLAEGEIQPFNSVCDQLCVCLLCVWRKSGHRSSERGLHE
jgi:hypothetical protein